MGIEDARYEVYVEFHEKDILCTGTIWECERWIRKNGVRDTPYVIDKADEKKAKRRTKKPESSKTEKQSRKEFGNVVNSLF